MTNPGRHQLISNIDKIIEGIFFVQVATRKMPGITKVTPSPNVNDPKYNTPI